MIDKVTIAVGDMTSMAGFYGAVLGVELTPQERFGRTLLRGAAGGVEFLLCPKDLAGVEADVNTVQLRLVVADVDAAHAAGLARGGAELSSPQDVGGRRSAALRDPDGNSLELVAPA